MIVMFLAVPDSPGEASRRDQEGGVSESFRRVSGKSSEEVRQGPVMEVEGGSSGWPVWRSSCE